MFLPYLDLDTQWVGHVDYPPESLWVSRACESVEQLVEEGIVAIVL